MSTEVLNPPQEAAAQRVRGMEMPLQPLSLAVAVEAGEQATAAVGLAKSWKAESAKMFGLAGHVGALLDSKTEAVDVVALDNFGVQPVDRGPAAGAAAGAVPDGRLLGSWQYQVTGKLAMAKVLSELNAVHLKSGGPAGIQAEAVKHIANEQLDNTFYIVDLGNVVRMFKAGIA